MTRLPARRGPDKGRTEQNESQELERRCPRRPTQPALVVQVLEHLRLNFATRHALASGSILIIDHGEPAGANQHQLVLEPKRIDLAIEHVDRRHVAPRVAPGIVDTELSVAFSGRNKITDADGLDRRAVDEKANFLGMQSDPKHFHGQ